MSPLQDIERLLRAYFDGLHHCDIALLAEVFHPRAIYATADETPLRLLSMAEYLPIVAARQSPASRKDIRHDHIDAIDLAGANTAMARVRCSIGERHFTDFLSLVRENGNWRIISKVFQITPPRN